MVILVQCVVVVKIKLGMVGVVVVEMIGVVVGKMKMGIGDGGSCSG